jgi:hypothetical protein
MLPQVAAPGTRVPFPSVASHSGCSSLGYDRAEASLSSQTPLSVQPDFSFRPLKSAVALNLMVVTVPASLKAPG